MKGHIKGADRDLHSRDFIDRVRNAECEIRASCGYPKNGDGVGIGIFLEDLMGDASYSARDILRSQGNAH
jgi:hypothetical protein